ncbi:MAG TPA: hypothetical protein VMU38_06585 [Candidatus Binatia bacterium]|nr:hypothetical protein [Candidatus Binatia bacterium]
MHKWGLGIGSLLLWLALPAAAPAIPLFAHQYGVTCEKCHSVIPHLNEFGAAFLVNGERFPGVSSGPAIPFSAKANLVDSSEYQGEGPDGQGLPKAIVDEIELFSSATIGSRANYFVEQYVVDGGEPGLLRDAWISDRVNPWDAKIPVYLQGGQFTLPLPVDPETFRDTYQSYTPYELSVGANPFTFFDPAMGMRLGIGDGLRGVSGQIFAGPGYTRQSGLPATGVDTELYLQDAIGPFTLSTWRYDGLRPVAGGPGDRFDRLGFGFTYGQWARFSSEFVIINGWDSNCGTPGLVGCRSSGGFEQLRYAFNRRLFAEARYEGTYDPVNGFTRDGVVLMGYGPTENTRVTIEDVISHTPQTMNTMNAQFTIAY